MINKRLLIKHLLAHNNENSFYDKKLKIDFSSTEGKAKFLKHVCALSNSNPKNNAFIVIGIEDENNKIIGVDFFDDSKIQNLINAYLNNPPNVQYENIAFPHLPSHKVVGLVTVTANSKKTTLIKNIWKYQSNTIFFRDGSISMPKPIHFTNKNDNSLIVAAIEKHAQNNIEHTLNGVFNFMNTKNSFNPKYNVFKEYFVVCWSGKAKTVNKKTFYSRVDIELINEQVRLFFSALDDVSIRFNENSFTIIEYVNLGIQDRFKHYPLTKTTIQFNNNASYTINTELLFKTPKFNSKSLNSIYIKNNVLINKLKQNTPLTKADFIYLKKVPGSYLICYLNNFKDAKSILLNIKPLFKKQDKDTYLIYKETIRVLRKIKYS